MRTRFLLNLSVIALFGGIAAAQNVTATLVGTVKDSTGAVVSGATVTLVDPSTQGTRNATTDSTGNYTFQLLKPALYHLSAEKQGFKQTVVQDFELHVDQTARIDITLQIGNVAQSVSVTAEAPLVESETGSIGQVVNEKQVQDLPLNGRAFYNLVLLAPGTTPTMPNSFIAANRPIPGQLSTPAFYVGGAREQANGYLIDGVDAEDPHLNTPSLFPSVDAIQEFKLETNAYSAEYGHYSAQISIETRSGTNNLHGSAFEFLRNDAMDAANFFTNLAGQQKTPLRYNQFGGTLGGPLSIPKVYSGKNRTFYFGSWESTRIRDGSTGQLAVPTEAQRNGDFSAAKFQNNQPIFDPATTRTVNGSIVRDPFPGNIIPAGRISSFAKGILSYYPLPTSNASTGNNYFTQINNLSDSDQFMVRVDQRFGDKDNAFVRYSITNGNLTSNAAIPINGSTTDMRTQNVAMNYTHIFNATTLYELRMGYNRPKYFDLQAGSNGPNIWAQLGLANLLDDPIAYGAPQVTLTGFSGLGAGTFIPSNQLTNSYQLFQDVSLTRGAHSFKIGADLRKINYNDETEREQNGVLDFTGGLTANPAAATGTGVSLADLLLGLPLTAAGSSKSLATTFNGFSYGFFAQDDWKVNARATLNFGLRYDISPRMIEKHNHYSKFDPNYPGGRVLLAATNEAYIPGIGIAQGPYTPAGLVPTDKDDWSPRIGIAIRPFNNSKTAIRAGYGIFYDAIELQDIRTWARNPPYGSIISLQSDQNANSTSPTVLNVQNLFPAQGLNVPPDIYSPGGNYIDPYYQQWNLDLQQQMWSNFLFDFGYMGSKGTHLARRLLANQAVLDSNPAYPTPILTRRPYPLFGNTLRITDDNSNSTYNALVARIEKRFSQGFSFLFSYTYSKSIDSGSLIDDNPRDIYNLSLDRGRSDFDIRQNAVLSGSWDLPFGPGRPWMTQGFWGALAGGLQLNTIAKFHTGFPFSVAASGDVCNCGAPNQLAQQVGDPLTGFMQSRLKWFNTASFVQPATGTFGDSGRNILSGPGSATVDASLFRTFEFSKGWDLQFRGEFFNLFNHTNFGQPAATVGTSSYGIIQSAADARAIQLALKLSF